MASLLAQCFACRAGDVQRGAVIEGVRNRIKRMEQLIREHEHQLIVTDPEAIELLDPARRMLCQLQQDCDREIEAASVTPVAAETKRDEVETVPDAIEHVSDDTASVRDPLFASDASEHVVENSESGVEEAPESPDESYVSASALNSTQPEQVYPATQSSTATEAAPLFGFEEIDNVEPAI